MEHIYSWERKIFISNKQRSVFYNAVCNNKLSNSHHSDKDYTMQSRRQKHLLVYFKKIGCTFAIEKYGNKTLSEYTQLHSLFLIETREYFDTHV